MQVFSNDDSVHLERGILSTDNTREENPAGLGNQERRQLYRWKVSIPCTMERGDTIITGQIANLSLGGALITHVDAVPPEGVPLIVRFQVEKETVELEGKLIHTINLSFRGPWIVQVSAMEDGQVGSFGVEFQGSLEEIRSKLIPVFRNLASVVTDDVGQMQPSSAMN